MRRVQISCDICTRFARYLYSTKQCWIIRDYYRQFGSIRLFIYAIRLIHIASNLEWKNRFPSYASKILKIKINIKAPKITRTITIFCRVCYNCSYTMIAKRMKSLELHHPMIFNTPDIQNYPNCRGIFVTNIRAKLSSSRHRFLSQRFSARPIFHSPIFCAVFTKWTPRRG